MTEGPHTYRNWQIKVFRQRGGPPFLDFTAYCQKVTDKRVIAFNVDGMTPERCLELAKQKIDAN